MCADNQPVQREDLRHRLVLAGPRGGSHSRQLRLVGGQLHVLADTDQVRAPTTSRLPGDAEWRRRLRQWRVADGTTSRQDDDDQVCPELPPP